MKWDTSLIAETVANGLDDVLASLDDILSVTWNSEGVNITVRDGNKTRFFFLEAQEHEF